MKHVLAMVIASSVVLAACGSSESAAPSIEGQTLTGSSGVLEFTATPTKTPAQGANTFKLVIADATSHDGMPGLTCTAAATMPAMGDGSEGATVREISGGEYEADSVQFTMGGMWEVRFDCSMPGMSDTVAFTYDVP